MKKTFTLLKQNNAQIVREKNTERDNSSNITRYSEQILAPLNVTACYRPLNTGFLRRETFTVDSIRKFLLAAMETKMVVA